MSTSLRPRPPGLSYADEDDDDYFRDELTDLDTDFRYEDYLDTRSEGDEGQDTVDTVNVRRRRDSYVPSPLGYGSLVAPADGADGSASPLSSLSPTPTRSRSTSPALAVPEDIRTSARASTRLRSIPQSVPRALPPVSLSPRRQPRPFPMLPRIATPPLAHRISDSSNSASDSFEPVEVDPDSAPRRFTAQEKGKGRAIVQPIKVPDDDPDESIEIIAVKTGDKRKRAEGDDLGKEDVAAADEGMGLEERGIGAYMCPVCFSAPEQAVMTECGHILCAKCLHDSLLAAIRRNPNPYPQAYPGYPGNQFRGPRAGAAGRGGARTTRSGATRGRVRAEPVEWNWTAESLKSAWSEVMIRRYEAKLEKDGVERENWELIKQNDAEFPMQERLVVKEELKGLWSIDGKDWVIEGECPVCRKQIPGGYAPPHITLGGVIPLHLRVEAGR